MPEQQEISHAKHFTFAVFKLPNSLEMSHLDSKTELYSLHPVTEQKKLFLIVKQWLKTLLFF